MQHFDSKTDWIPTQNTRINNRMNKRVIARYQVETETTLYGTTTTQRLKKKYLLHKNARQAAMKMEYKRFSPEGEELLSVMARVIVLPQS